MIQQVRKCDEAALAHEVSEMVASWPPLTDAQCEELARLLLPYGGLSA